jgi:hypothetical protein
MAALPGRSVVGSVGRPTTRAPLDLFFTSFVPTAVRTNSGVESIGWVDACESRKSAKAEDSCNGASSLMQDCAAHNK